MSEMSDCGYDACNQQDRVWLIGHPKLVVCKSQLCGGIHVANQIIFESGFNPGWDHYAVFLGTTLPIKSAFLHPGV